MEATYRGAQAHTEEEQGQIMAIVLGVRFTIVAIMLVGSLLTLAGGIQTIRQQSFGLCIAGSVFAMLPCGCLCIFGLPVGIWGLIMLNQDSVRSGFS